MDGKLIIVEGIPGSGKTTTAQFARDWVAERGLTPRLHLEGDLDHPADFEAVACLSEPEYADLVARYAGCEDLLAQNSLVTPSGRFIRYVKLKRAYGEELPDGLTDVLARFDVYELPPDRYRALAVERWQAFAAQAAAGDDVYIFECCFLQNPLTVLLGKHNKDVADVQAHILAVAELLEALNPLLVYLVSHDVPQVMERIARERPREWVDFVTAYLTGQGYGKAHGLAGYDGVIQFYEMRQALELELIPQLGWRCWVIDNSDRDGCEMLRARLGRLLDGETEQ